MKTLITGIKRLALALCFATPFVSRAEAITAVNPVTGETETYTYKFIGSDTWDGTEYWQDSNGDNPTAVPAKSGDNIWDPILFDGNTINIAASMSVEGWNLSLGLYNGANVRLNSFVKWQGDTDMWVTVDGTSKFTVGAFGKGNIADGKVIKCSTTRANGIEWLVNLESTGNANNTFEYYLAGEGSVSYQGVTAANHKIKQADVALSGNEKSVQSKTLVSFTSTDKTFTADAAIKVKNGDTVLKTVYLTSVTADATTLTTDDDVGACELVQTSTGIVLYYVDGDPADVPVEEKTYKPSININFTNGAGNGLTTQADVGLSGYEVPGTSWNNYVVANSTFSTVNAVDSTGAASAMSGVSVTISNVSGSWSCSGLTASSDFRQSYIDESAAKSTPTVTVTGIPYYKYRVLVYHSTDTANVPFGYDTINGTDYTYVNDALAKGTTAWGNSGAKDSANAIAEGGNVLVTEALSGSTLTVVGHRAGGDSSARGCIAAIQIIEVKADVGENDLEIAVDGETEYTVTAEDAEKTGTVYLTGSGTLTLAGENKISAATIEIGGGVTLVVNADRLDGTTFTGAGTVVYDGVVPPTGKGWTESAWTGTVWIKNKSGITGNNNATTGVQPNSLGNSLSKVKFSGVNGWIDAPVEFNPEIVLDNAGYDYALQLTNGNSPNTQTEANYNRATTIKKLSGSGTLCCGGTSTAAPTLKVYDASGFTGSINTVNADDASRTGLVVVFCDENTELPDSLVNMFINTNLKRTIYVASGKTVTLDSAATWTAVTGFGVEGTLVANGTLASSAAAAVTGSGTVTFGGVPSPVDGENETKWWKNSAWTGTVEIKGASIAGNTYAFNDYGNATSTVKLTNCSGWLTGGYTCVPALEIGGTFTWNDGWSGLNNTFKVGTLKGSGTISIPNQGAPTAVWQITDDWSGFTGAVVGNNDAGKRVLVFGSTLPASVTAGEIYVSEGATLNLDNASGAWWGAGMGFVVDGTVKASSRSKWGGGTYMKLGDTGVLELVSTSNTDDQNTEMGNITGTGTLKFSSTAGWRSFPKTDANMPATTLTIQTELDDSLILPTKNDGETVVGNIAGSKNIRSDWSNNGDNGRILTVTQSKDTEWQGKFVANRITQFNVVAPAEGTPGTLTLSGTQTATIPAQIDGSVNLTGTWVGATTVAGTIGGTGTLTGDLTFSAGSTFKAFASDEDGLAVSGTVTCPEEGTVTVDVSALTPETDVALLKAADLDATKFALAEGAPEGATLEVVEGVLTLKLAPATVDITVPAVTGATVAVTADGQPVEGVAGVYTVNIGAAVVVTYTIDSAAYQITGDTQISFDATAETTSVTGPTTKACVAWIYNENKGLVASYADEMTAVGAFLNSGIGESVRFLAQSTYHDMLMAACSYDESTITYTRLPTVATITIGSWEYKYTSLAAAVADPAANGQTVVLVKDVTLDARVEPNLGADTTLTIDLGGKTITREGTSGNGSAFDVKSGTVTIKNGTIDCTQDDTEIAKDGVYAITSRSGSTVFLETLTITVDSECGACVYPFGGSTATVKSGTYKNITTTPYRYKTEWTGMAVNQPNNAVQILFLEGGTYSKVDPKLGDDSGKWTNFCAEGYTTKAVDGGWEVAEVQEVPVTPGSQTEPVDTQEAAEADAAKVVPSVPAAVAEVLSDDQETAYKALFETKVVEVTVGETPKYAVEVVMKESVKEALQEAVDAEAEDFAEAAAEAAADAVNGGSATVSTVAGLYYVVEAGTDVDGIAPASCTLATGSTLDLTIPNKGTKGFYKLSVSVTPVDVQE